jgi:phosphoribosylanthranilate isomerase
MRARVKICCIADAGEARMAADAGADLLGLVGPMPTGPGVVTIPEARAIADAAPPWAEPVLLTAADTPAAILADAEAGGVRTVQLVRHIAPEVHDALAGTAPWLRRIQVVHVEDREALGTAARYDGRADALLLDSGRPSVDELGGTGRAHDWAVSAEIVRRSGAPVFLAGGLSPQNVARALREVRPFGLDLCSGLRPVGRLDPGLLRAFMAEVARVAAERAGEAA